MVKKLLLAFALCLSPFVSSYAGITNGRFESGNLNGWSVFMFDRYAEFGYATPDQWGYAAAVGTTSFGPPLEGAYSAMLAALDYGPRSCSYDVFSPRCPSYPPTGVPSTPAGGPALAHPPYMVSGYNGAYIGQDFTAAAGDVLAWTWEWGGDGMDTMFAWLTDGVSGFYLQGRANGAFYAEIDVATGRYLTSNFSTGLLRDAPWDASFRIPTDGLWTIYFGVDQLGDNQGSSWMWLDNVRVPEPATVGLLLVGLLGLLLGCHAPRRVASTAGQRPSRHSALKTFH